MEEKEQAQKVLQERIRELEATNARLMAELDEFKRAQLGLNTSTESKQADELLRISEQKFSNIFKKIPFAASLSRMSDGRLVEVNDAFTQIFGYTRDEAVGRTSLELHLNPDADGRARILAEMRRKGSVWNQVHTLFTKSGEARLFSVSVDTLELGDEKYILNFAQDITGRTWAKEELNNTRKMLEMLLAQAPVGFAYFDRDLHYLLINDRLAKMNGLPVEAHIGKTIADIVPSLWPALKQVFDRIMETGEPVVGYVICGEIPGQPGVTGYWSESWYPVCGTAGEVIGFGAVVEDITQRKLAEEQVHYQAALLSNVNDAIIATDAQYRITAWNAAAESLYGWKAEEVIGRNGMEIMQTVWPEKDADEMRRNIIEAGRWRGEAIQAHKSGTRFHVEVSSIVLRNADNQITGYLSANRDITERKQVEETLRRYELLSKQSRDIILIMRQADGRVLEANSAALQAYGYSHEEMMALTIRDLRASSTLGLTADQMVKANLEGILFETIHQRKDGSTFPVEVGSQGADIGGVRTLISIIRDISERKHAEERIERSNQKMNEILTSIQDDFYVLDRNWAFVYASKLFTSKIGKEPEDFIGKNIWEMFPKHVGTIFEENLRAAMETREVRRFEIGGKYTSAWYRMTAFPSAEGITVLGTDITERKRAEDEAQSMREMLETVVKYMPASISLIRGSDLRLQLINPAYQSIAPAKEMIGHTLDELWPETGQDFAAICQRVLETGEPHDVTDELNLLRRQVDGPLEQTYFSWSLHRVRLPGDEGWGLLNTSWETTRRKQAEDALLQSRATLLSFYDSAPFMMGIAELCDDNSVIVSGNRTAAEFFAMKPTELPGKTGLELGNPIEVERLWVENYRLSQQAGTPVHFEYEYPRAGGPCWLSATVAFIGPGPTANPRFSYVVEEITERKQVEAELVRLASFPERNPNPIVELKYSGEVIYLNPKAKERFPELTGYGFQHPVLAGLEQFIQDFETGSKTHVTREIKFGEACYHQSVVNIPESQRIRLYHIDITLRRNAEDALHQAQADLEHAQKVGQIGSWRLDVRQDVLTWSDENHRIFGVPIGTRLTYETFLASVHPDDRNYVNEKWEAGLRGEPYDIEHRILVAGQVKWIREKAYLEFDEAGELLGGFGIAQDITERKQAEVALRESDERFSSAFRFSPIGVHIFRFSDGCSVDANDAFLSLIEYSREELIGHSAAELNLFVDPDQRAKWMQDLNEYGAVRNLDVQMRGKSGRIADVLFSLVKIELAGEVMGLVMAIDVTDQKQAEQKLMAAHAEIVTERNRLRAVMEALPVGVAILDVHGGNPQANHAFEQIWGGPRPEVDGTANYAAYRAWWSDTSRPVQPDEWASAQALKRGETVIGQVLKIKRFDEKFAYILNSCAPIFDNMGQVQGGAVAIMDITATKEAEEALRKAHDELEQRVRERTAELATMNDELLKEIAERKAVERQLRIQTTAMEAAANGIVITDSLANIQWANPALFQMSGYNSDEFLGKSTRIFHSGQQDNSYYQCLWDTILAGNVWRGEIINKRKDGSMYVEEQTITPVRDEQGQIAHFIAIKQDITARKQAEKELEQRNVELEVISNAEREQRQLAEALVKAALVLNRSLNQDEVLQHILEQIREVIPYQFASVTLLDGETFYDACYQSSADLSETQYDIKQRFHLKKFPVLRKMRETGRPFLLPSTSQDSDWAVVENLAWSRSFLSAPLLVEKQVIGFVNLFSAQPFFFTQSMCDRLVAFAAHAAVAIQNSWLFERVRAGSERMQSLSRRLVEIQENERLYIARELHDEAGQMLTSLMVDLRVLEKESGHSQVILEKVAEMEASLNEVFDSLHRVAMALRPATLDHLGLVAALRQYVESVGEKQNLKVSFVSEKVRERLPANVETVLYRIVQEALTNVVRHAHATHVDVVLTVRNDKLILIIEDDGMGFNPDSILDGSHLGMFGMRERAEMISGKLAIESAPGKGTTVIVEVDYDVL